MAKQKQEKSDAERPRGNYPFNTLAQCLKVPEAMAACGGVSGPVPKTVLANQLGFEDSSSGFQALLSSARIFGIIEGGGDIILTEAGKDYASPTADNSKRLAELKIFVSPGAYKFLVDRFDGHVLPQSKMLSGILQRHNVVPRSWTDRTAAMFLSAANDLRLIDRGMLRYGVAKHEAERNGTTGFNRPRGDAMQEAQSSHEQASAMMSDVGHPAAKPGHPPSMSTVADDSNVWIFSESGGTIRVETPRPLPKSLWDKLKLYVELLKPAGDGQGGTTDGSKG